MENQMTENYTNEETIKRRDEALRVRSEHTKETDKAQTQTSDD